MAFELPPAVLRKLRNAFQTNPLTLTETETGIAKRIEICSSCDHVWFRRLRKKPSRCPQCHTRAWDRPFVSALVENWNATHPDQPRNTPAPARQNPNTNTTGGQL